MIVKSLPHPLTLSRSFEPVPNLSNERITLKLDARLFFKYLINDMISNGITRLDTPELPEPGTEILRRE